MESLFKYTRGTYIKKLHFETIANKNIQYFKKLTKEKLRKK